MFDTIKIWLHRNTVTAENFLNGAGKWQWHLKASNGEILAHSEEYSSLRNCNDTLEMLDGKKIQYRES